MHNEKVHIESGGKIHEIQLHNTVGTGVGASAIAQDDYCARSGILIPEMLFPYMLDVVAYEPGSIVADAYCHIAHILRNIEDAVRNNLPVGERCEVVVKGLGLADSQDLSVSLEVSDKFLLLGVNADYRKIDFCRSFTYVRNVQELRISVLDILHRKVLCKGAPAEPQLLKYLPDNIFRYLLAFLGNLSGNLRCAHGYPDDTLVLRQSGSSWPNDEVEALEPFGMTVQKTLPSTTATTYPSWLRRISGFDFTYRVVYRCFAHTEKLCNFVHAASAKSKSLGSEILSSSVFVELGHKQLLLSCEHFWRGFRKHLNHCGRLFKFTGFSPVLQIYLINNQIFNNNFRRCFEHPIKVMNEDVLHRYKSASPASKLYQVIF